MTSILDSSQALILGLHHATGTPWYLTIPLVALGVTAVFRLPFTLYTQNLIRWRTRYTPIIQAWAPSIFRRVATDAVPPAEQRTVAKARTQKEIKRLWKRAGLQEWKLYTGLASLPIWLVVIDSIRRLCGGPRGLLGTFFLPPKETPAPADPAQGFSAAPFDGAAAGDVVDAASSAVEAVTHTTAEPSLMTEGALWFTDLTAADPYHILPFALSAVLVANMLPKNNARLRELLGMEMASTALKTSTTDGQGTETTSVSGGGGAVRRGLGRGMLVVSLLIGPLTMDLPAAVHLYWLTSACASRMTSTLVNKLLPLNSKTVSPCRGVELPIIRPCGKQSVQTTEQDTTG